MHDANRNWKVEFSNRAKKSRKALPEKIKSILDLLVKEIEIAGPVRTGWPNYSKLDKRKKLIPDDAYHCHLKKGNPTYVACWCVIDRTVKFVEVFYVGTHENAPY